MLIVALTIFAALMGAFAPTIVSLYIQYSKESVAPYYIQAHPYLAPFLGIVVVLALSFAFLIYASVREYHKNQGSSSDLETLKKRLELVEQRTQRENAVNHKKPEDTDINQ